MTVAKYKLNGETAMGFNSIDLDYWIILLILTTVVALTSEWPSSVLCRQ